MDVVNDRGAHTKGRAAKLVAGSDFVEIKATIPARQVDAALARFHLETEHQEERFIYFFDTPDLALLQQGIVARARRRVGGKHDSTIKFRPVDPDDVPPRWQRFDGFKIESDASDRSVVRSASLTMPVRRGLIKAVASGDEPIGSLFTEEQINFLLSLTNKRFDPSTVVTLGPIRAYRWKFDHPALPWPLTGELWRLPDEQRILEVSVKTPAIQAAVGYFGFMGWLAELGAERDEAQQAKTRWALEYFAGQLDTPATAGDA